MTGSPARRVFAAVTTAALVATTAACGGDESGPPTINVYYAPGAELPEGRRRLQPAGPGHATGSSTRCCPAAPTTSGCRWCAGWPPRTTAWTCSAWTSPGPQEFASADWIREWTGDGQGRGRATARCQAPLESASYEGKLYAAPKNTNTQLLWYRSGPGAEPAEDLGRDDPARRRSSRAQGKPVPGRSPWAPSTRAWWCSTTTWSPAPAGRSSTTTAPRPSLDEGAVEALEHAAEVRHARASPTRRSPTPRKTTPGCSSRAAAARSSSTGRSSGRPCRRRAPDLQGQRQVGALPGRRREHAEQGDHRRLQPGRSASTRKHPDEAFDAALCLRNAGAPAVLRGQRRRAADDREPSTTTPRWPRRTR